MVKVEEKDVKLKFINDKKIGKQKWRNWKHVFEEKIAIVNTL